MDKAVNGTTSTAQHGQQMSSFHDGTFPNSPQTGPLTGELLHAHPIPAKSAEIFGTQLITLAYK